jgi:hypothetical protein
MFSDKGIHGGVFPLVFQGKIRFKSRLNGAVV